MAWMLRVPASLLPLFAGALVARALTPEPLPNPPIAGFRFPENEVTLTRWITDATRAAPADAAPAFEKIVQHGWGLWAAITSETNQRAAGQRLRVFETWETPEDLARAGVEPPPPVLPRRFVANARSPLRELAQLREPRESFVLRTRASVIDRVMGFTKLDPVAAAHVRAQELLQRATLDALLDGGAQQITPFPPGAMAVKPLFQLVKRSELVAARYYRLKAWSGPPGTPQPCPPAQWPGSVWIDVFGGGAGAGAIDFTGVDDGSSRTAETTYPLGAFISYALSLRDAQAVNANRPGTNAAAGDLALLVAMHVSTRETARWTWQTFWWTPAPEAPPEPSSATIASLRPGQLSGPASHYAMALSYTMLSPDQPYVGGANRAGAVYVYNPWIEARMGPADLPDSRDGFNLRGEPAANNVGMQTNCMSCHAQANYNPRQLATAPRFTGARYVDLSDPQFRGTLQVDFLWSIARHAQ